ncbi:hypothetical protein C8R32_103216 [Nitrosospira sp. Nsp5]|uniref:Uncharacterized protein n=1 Tax=Nitrosospira multiformis TaxID=1231 RepID=A0ABY0T5L0_9PROT|nr:hypothetical protein C8R32_103216 [Nitrosospira sp. Nsp5]SDQ26469.1 hypothetical protein SAMN05216402_0084 [Nitrosospira multiformis]
MMGKSFNPSLVVGQDGVRRRVRGRDAGLMESLTFFRLANLIEHNWKVASFYARIFSDHPVSGQNFVYCGHRCL